ncbi:RNA polymerase sigma factor [Actomonas aquatica]|uniref:Sigma-70 family RNA polymerase sigma factor n=1 Tax=Actomonas aquatica TaxID=2866162 RepID=A0ABZ1C6Z2_9BACT|nr:sigma-70 family RNA polymerase sigma factor [Opitutus sp. WL0086]WRQ87493.1 sigma-70 family RNA polymerase sigma factor [Opitutus sp. WL0086]
MERDARQVLSELLILRAQGGDERAFAELHQLWCGDVERYAAGKVGDRHGAEEVAQSSWVAIARGLGRLDDPARFAGWAFRIVARRAADWIRGRQTARRQAEELQGQVATEVDDGPAPARDDDITRLQECIAGMDTATRELLELFYQTGLSVGEIADVLGVPAGTVKSRLFHAREALKRQIERESP